MSTRPLRVAVCGVGHLGRIHARIYAEHPGAELVAVVDVDEAAAGAVAEAHGCAALGQPGDLPEDLDAASVVVPTTAHAEVAVPLLERGVPCLVEKPLAGNLSEAERLLQAADRGGTLLAVGHVERFQPGVRRLAELDHEPRFIECHRLAPFSFRGTDVGVVHDLMIHDLDLILHFVGAEVESFDAAGGRILTQSEDLASVRLVFRNGARANVTASRVSLEPMRRFRMFSGDGYVSLDFTKNRGTLIRKGAGFDRGIGELETADPATLAGLAAAGGFLGGDLLDIVQLELEGEERPLQAELGSFLTHVREGTPPEVTGEDGLRALDLAHRIATEIRAQAW